jgi:hypothetical protein
MGWNNGTNSNQLYRPEASRLLTGAPADTPPEPCEKTHQTMNRTAAGGVLVRYARGTFTILISCKNFV